MNRVYKISYYILFILRAIFYPMKIKGRENIPDGAAMVCCNHSNNIDPILLAYAIGAKHPLHFMAKAELFKTKFLSRVIKIYGGFSIDRGKNDINSIRTAMKLLKDGEKIGIFPEGTRASEDDEVEGKTGTVRLAMKMKVPVLPVYMTRNKRLFHRVYAWIGEPYYVAAEPGADFALLSAELMKKIYGLKE